MCLDIWLDYHQEWWHDYVKLLKQQILQNTSWLVKRPSAELNNSSLPLFFLSSLPFPSIAIAIAIAISSRILNCIYVNTTGNSVMLMVCGKLGP